jgi:hypothetical protein
LFNKKVEFDMMGIISCGQFARRWLKILKRSEEEEEEEEE